jgi:hypothetical protein
MYRMLSEGEAVLPYLFRQVVSRGKDGLCVDLPAERWQDSASMWVEVRTWFAERFPGSDPIFWPQESKEASPDKMQIAERWFVETEKQALELKMWFG